MGKYRGNRGFKNKEKRKKNSTPHKIGKYLMRSNKAVKNKLHTKYALTEKLNYSIFIKKQKNKSFLEC